MGGVKLPIVPSPARVLRLALICLVSSGATEIAYLVIASPQHAIENDYVAVLIVVHVTSHHRGIAKDRSVHVTFRFRLSNSGLEVPRVPSGYPELRLKTSGIWLETP